MKIIFDSEKQKEEFLNKLDIYEVCPDNIHGLSGTNGCHNTDITCQQCWENVIEMEVRKPTIVEVAEEFFGYKFTEWQKEYLTNAYAEYKEKGNLTYVPARGSTNSYGKARLQAFAVLYDDFLESEGAKSNEKK